MIKEKAETNLFRAQSDTSKGMMKKLISEFDSKGWKKVQQMKLAYGSAYFSKLVDEHHFLNTHKCMAPEDCCCQVIKNETDMLNDSDVDDPEISPLALAILLSYKLPLPNSTSPTGEPTHHYPQFSTAVG